VTHAWANAIKPPPVAAAPVEKLHQRTEFSLRTQSWKIRARFLVAVDSGGSPLDRGRHLLAHNCKRYVNPLCGVADGVHVGQRCAEATQSVGATPEEFHVKHSLDEHSPLFQCLKTALGDQQLRSMSVEHVMFVCTPLSARRTV